MIRSGWRRSRRFTARSEGQRRTGGRGRDPTPGGAGSSGGWRRLGGIGRQHGGNHGPGRGAPAPPAGQTFPFHRAGAENFPPAPAGPPCGAGRPGGDRAPGLPRRLVPAPSGSAPPSPASPPARGSPGPDSWKRKGGPEAAARSRVNRGSVLRRAPRRVPPCVRSGAGAGSPPPPPCPACASPRPRPI